MHFLLRRCLQQAAAGHRGVRPFTHLTTTVRQPTTADNPAGPAPRRQLFWEPDRKGGYNKDAPRVSRKQLILEGLRDLKQEIVMWRDEVQEKLESDPVLVFRPGETDVIWDFNDPKVLEKWVASSDSDHNEGQSHCTLVPSEAGRALFSGDVQSIVPKDGMIKRAGYCNIKSMRSRVSVPAKWLLPFAYCNRLRVRYRRPQKSFKRDTYLDWSQYNTLVIRLRGDGRSYLLNLSTEGYFDLWWFDIYHYVLFTRGGPHWQTARVSALQDNHMGILSCTIPKSPSQIPFSKFLLASKGRIQDRQCRIPLNKVTGFGVSVSGRNGHEGPFGLEIDFVGLEFDPLNNEHFAYEMYKMPKYVVAT